MRQGVCTGQARWLGAALVTMALGATSLSLPELHAQARGKPAQTIGDVTVVAGMEGLPVQGYGLVVGLKGTGSNPPPSDARTQLLHLMKKRGVEAPESLLRSEGTALVLVRAVIPPGARRKDRVDALVSLMPGDQATSLRGGWLLETVLYEAAGVAGGVVKGDRMAVAAGPIHVDEDDPRRGTVPGGAVSLTARSFQLLTGNRYRSARYTVAIARRINDRFPIRGPGGKDVATAKNDTQVDLRVPPVYEHNPARFLTVVRSIPLWRDQHTEQAIQARLERLSAELLQPDKALAAAVALEGIGRRAVPVLKQALSASDVNVRFFAAEALAYLGDPAAARPLADIARADPAYRAHALAALATLDEAASRLELRALINEDADAELRYGAFRALRLQDRLSKAFRGELIDGYIRLHVVPSNGPPLIHVTTRGEPEIVVFGERQRLLTPLTLRAGDEILLTANTGDTGLLITRYAVGKPPVKEPAPLEIVEVIRTVAKLGARYPDLVSMLRTAHKNLNLPGELAVDAVPDPSRLIDRLHESDAERVAGNAPVPFLFRVFTWHRPSGPASGQVRPAAAEKPIAGERSEDDERYLKKPGFFERLFRRKKKK